MDKKSKYRYPGIAFFKSDDEDIFCGRKEDSEKLYTQIMLSKTIVLHAESGTGKSSLIQAGILPLFKINNPKIVPVTIRFRDEKGSDSVENDYLVSKTIDCIRKKRKLDGKLSYVDPKDNDLWYVAKLCEKNKESLLLVFDQFEDLQGFSFTQIDCFKKKLSNLFNTSIPIEIYNEIEEKTLKLFDGSVISDEDRNEYNTSIEFLESPLNVKAIFVIREDKLGVMNLLSDYFADILKNDYFLLPLDKKNAYNAIKNPAKLEGDYLSPKFEIEEDAVKFLVNSLSDPNTDRIDPVQIQIICRNIERKVLPKKQNESFSAEDKLKISINDLPPIGDIINDFYKEIWSEIKQKYEINDNEYAKIRKEINKELVIDKKKNLVNENKLLGIVKRKEIVEDLVRDGLLNRIQSGDDNYYIICHDRLIGPINKELNQLINEEKAKDFARNVLFKVLVPSLVILLFIAMVVAWKFRNLKLEAEEAHALYIFKTIRKSNPTLSYMAAQKWLKNRHARTSDKFQTFLGEFDSTKAFIVGIFPTSSDIISADILTNQDKFDLTEGTSLYSWDMKRGILLSSYQVNDGKILKLFEKNKEKLLLIQNDNYELEIRNKKGEKGRMELGNINSFYISNPIAVSDAGNYLLIGNQLWNLNSRKPIKVMKIDDPEIGYRYYYNSIVLFFHNNKRIVLCNGNEIKIYSIEKKNSTIKCIATLSESLLGYNEITSLVIDHGDKNLIAGNNNNELTVWRLEDNNARTGKDTIIVSKTMSLKGHSKAITCLSISPDDSLLLSGSKDQSAILWDLKEAKKIAVLKGGDANIVYTGFSEDGKQMITGTDGGLIFIWKKEKVSTLFNENKLVHFSPFNYYVAGLSDVAGFSERDGYYPDTIFILNQLSNTLQYLISLPTLNQNPGDLDYLNSLETSLREVKRMYNKLFCNPDFTDSISLCNKKLLIQDYNQIIYWEPELLLKTQNKCQLYDRYGIYYIETSKMLLFDTTDVKYSKTTIDNLTLLGAFFRDSCKNINSNYSSSLVYLRNAMKLYDAFSQIYPKNQFSFKLAQIEIYKELTKTYLLTGKADSALLMSNHIAEIVKKNLTDYSTEGDFFDLAFLFFRVGNIEKAKQYFMNAAIQQKRLAEDYGVVSYWGSLSWYYLFCKDYKNAESSANTAIRLAKEQKLLPNEYIWIYTNLMHAYLFQDKFENAKQILLEYKDTILDVSPRARTFKQAILDDYSKFEEVNMVHLDMNKIKSFITADTITRFSIHQ